MAPTGRLFHDQWFEPPSVHVGAEDVFAVSDAMKRFLRTEVSSDFNSRGYQQGFIDALYTKGKLKLEYESAVTRNAAEAFANVVSCSAEVHFNLFAGDIIEDQNGLLRASINDGLRFHSDGWQVA
jgi:hypothetical protein